MALVDIADYKIALAEVATQINVMWAQIPELENTMHPLRDLLKQLDMSAPGVVTSDEDYVDQA